MAASIVCKKCDVLQRNWLRLLIKSHYRYSSVSVQNNDDNGEVKYPPIKPRYPPGSWGQLSENQAWKRYEATQEIKNDKKLKTVSDRIKNITSKERHHIVTIPVKDTFRLGIELYSFITKTHILEGLPDVYKSTKVDENLFKKAKACIEEALLTGHEKQHNKKNMKMFENRLERSKYIIKNIMSALVPLSFEYNRELMVSQIDEDVPMQAFWDRRQILTPDDENYEHQVRDMNLGNIEFAVQTKTTYQIRTELPLTEFVEYGDRLCQNAEFADLKYKLKSYGLIRSVKQPYNVNPGFNHGDPCEFGLLNIQDTSHLHWCEHSDGLMMDGLQCQGMISSFLWLLGQAYYQGFNYLMDLTYPLTTQTILTNSQYFMFCAYQMNTIDLWKDNLANPYQNLAWFSDKMKLYEKIEDGKVIGLNDEVCEMLLKCLLMKTLNRGYNMKPTLPEKTQNLLEKTKHITAEPLPVYVKVEKVKKKLVRLKKRY